MKFGSISILALVLLCSSNTAAFVHRSSSLAQSQHRRFYSVGSSLYSSPVQQKTDGYNTLQEFNVELDRLAEEAGSYQHAVISKATQCQLMWEQMSHDHPDDDPLCPDTISFNTVLKAWCRCCNTISESHRLHKELKQEVRSASPSDASAWAAASKIAVYTSLDAAKHATQLLASQQQGGGSSSSMPDVASYNIVIDAWSKSRVKEAPETAERILKEMLKHETVEPDTFSYHGVLNAWANSGREESVQRCEQILKHLDGLNAQQQKVQGATPTIRPSIRTVNEVLNAYAKRAGKVATLARGQRSEQMDELGRNALLLLDKTKKRYEETNDARWRPDVTTYTSVMDVFARAGHYEATQQVEDLLKEVIQAYADSNNHRTLCPNFRTYTTVVSAWSRTRSSEAPKRVEALLAQMTQSSSTRPNARTFTSAIQCWARSRDPNKAKHCLRILKNMRAEYEKSKDDALQPTIISYNACIEACARCQDSLEQQTEALKIAFAIEKAAAADAWTQPNQATYFQLFKAVSNLLPFGGQRNQIASAVFEKCKKAGVVNLNLVKALHQSVDTKTLTVLLDGHVDSFGRFDYDALPSVWSTKTR